MYLGQDEKSWAVVNRTALELIDPSPGWALVGGSAVLMRWTGTDAAGGPLAASEVAWQQSRDGLSWSAVSLGAGAILEVPPEVGAYYLKAIWAEAPGYTREKVFRFEVSAAPAALHIEMGVAQGAEYSLGEGLSEHASGKVYGFTSDHTDRVGRFSVLDLSGSQPQVRVESSIALDEGQSFKVWVGSSRVKVVVHLGPIDARSTDEVRLNGRMIQIPGSHWDRVVRVEGEVRAASGVLEVQGSADLPLMELTVEALASDAPLVGDSVAEEALIVLGKPTVHRSWDWEDGPGWWGHRRGWEWE